MQSRKEAPEDKNKQKGRVKEAKSKSISKSKSRDLRFNFTSTMKLFFDNKTHVLIEGWFFNLMVLHHQPKNH